MSTKLLKQIRAQDQDDLAARHNGEDVSQASRKWVVTALKPVLLEAEFAAAVRAVEESGSLFRGREAAEGIGFSMYRCPKTGMLTSRAEQAQLREGEAIGRLWALQHAVHRRLNMTRDTDIVEWIIGRSTLLEVAQWLGFQRFTGTPRRIVVDTRPVTPCVRRVLCAMAEYYLDCQQNADQGLDNLEQITP